MYVDVEDEYHLHTNSEVISLGSVYYNKRVLHASHHLGSHHTSASKALIR